MSPVAGVFNSFPSSEKREPWQGQSQLRSFLFHLRAHPKWGQRFTVGHNSPPTALTALRASCFLIICLDGEKTSANSFFFPLIKSVSSSAATKDEVIPHLLKPVTTYKSGVLDE